MFNLKHNFNNCSKGKTTSVKFPSFTVYIKIFKSVVTVHFCEGVKDTTSRPMITAPIVGPARAWTVCHRRPRQVAACTGGEVVSAEWGKGPAEKGSAWTQVVSLTLIADPRRSDYEHRVHHTFTKVSLHVLY